MPHREPRPDPRLPSEQRSQAPSTNTNPPQSGKAPTRPPPTEPGDFLGLGMELSAITRRGGSSGQQEDGASSLQQQQHPQTPPIPPRMLETTTFRPRVDSKSAPRPSQQPNAPGTNAPSTTTPTGANLSATGRHLRFLGTTSSATPTSGAPATHAPSPNPQSINTQSTNTQSTNTQSTNTQSTNTQSTNTQSTSSPSRGRPTSITPGPLTPSESVRSTPPPASPPTVSGLMQPMAFEVLPPRYEEQPVRTNSWLLALDDASAGRAGAEPVIADPSDLRRSPRVARPLDTSFSEPEPVTRRSAPWLVGLLLGVAACSLVFVFWSTLTHVDPKSAQTKVVPPVAPNPRSVANEELSDPLDSGSAHLKHKKPSTSARATQRPDPSSVTTSPTSSTTEAPRATPRTRPPPAQEPLSAPPQQDVFTLPTPPSADASTSDAPSDPPDLAPAPNSSGGEQSSAQPQSLEPPPSATWWSGSLHAMPLAVGESGPDAGEYAASRERQALVGDWLMRQSRSASPLADTASVFPFVTIDAGGAQPRLSSTCPNVSAAVIEHAPVANAASTRERDTGSARERDATTASASDTNAESETTPVSIVWEGSTVPADRITANARLLTPQVGRVRAGLRNGHAIEGRLYAVGTGNVWIDTEVGRLVLQRSEIDRLEQVATPVEDTPVAASEGTPAPAAPAVADKSAPTAPIAAPVTAKVALVPEPPPRVRVKTPGGVFFGQIIAREGATLTLLTDEGSRITLESDDVEAAPIAKAVVKHEPATSGKQAASGGNPPQPH